MFRSTETPTRNGSGGPLSPPPLRRPKPEYLPAYLSNGFLGVRVGTIPLVEGLVIVSGLRAVDSVHGIETFARGPYPIQRRHRNQRPEVEPVAAGCEVHRTDLRLLMR